ncbi:MAG: malto-oligosyltrehalose synthase [Pirellulales bacterium]
MNRTAKTCQPFVHGFQPRGDGGSWNLWAPRAARVDLLLATSDSWTSCPMRPREGGCFEYTADHVPVGQRYLYRLDGDRARPDPASRWQPEGVHGPSAVWRPDPRQRSSVAWTGKRLDELVTYELHVGTFTPEGTFDALRSRLPALRSLGITAIELMPLGQFPGTRGWGYDGTYWFAVQHSYGGPAGLQRLVDACHAHDLAVIVDVVYSHFGPEGNYLAEFAPCFTARHQTPWGDAVNFDDRGSAGMRSFVLDHVRYWIRTFELDGLRLDAVHALCDDHQPHILQEIQQVAAEEARRLGRPVHVIAESNQNDARLLDPPARGGYGLDAQWNDDFHHCVHALLTGERDGYYVDFDDPPRQLVKALNDVFVYDGQFSPFRGHPHGRPVGAHGGERFVVSIQTHDQIGNRALGDRLGTLLPPDAQRLSACLLLLAPYLPLLFMGEEYGECRPFPFFCDFADPALQAAVRGGRRAEFARFAWAEAVPDPCDPATFAAAQLTWEWPAGSTQAGLRQLYHDLLALRSRLPALRDFQHRSAGLADSGQSTPLLVLQRGTGSQRVICLFHLGSRAAPWPDAYRHLPVLLRSASSRYRGNSEPREEGDPTALQPFECVVLQPSMSDAHTAPPHSDEPSKLGAALPRTADSTGTDSTGTDSTCADSICDGRPSELSGMVDRILQALPQYQPTPTLPVATYRVQFQRQCTFRDIAAVVPYLYTLGISDLYASPFLKAHPGSLHGYDIVDHGAINPEIGTLDDLRSLRSALREHDMGLLADVVPNHMSNAPQLNVWWQDVLENGPSSPYATYFDIDWMPLKPDLAYKVLLPVLGDQFGKVLEAGQLLVQYEAGSFSLSYFERRFPLAPRSYLRILAPQLDEFCQQLGTQHVDVLELLSILTAIKNLPTRTETDDDRRTERRREKEIVKRRLHELVERSPEVAEFLRTSVRRINGQVGQPRSFDALDDLLRDQAYRLADWRVAADEINYRRFFDINELAAICTEQPQVFAETHRVLFELLDEGTLTGVRIDHPDGLYDPRGYLRQLQEQRFLQMCRRAWSRMSAPFPVVSPQSPGWADDPWPVLEPPLLAAYRASTATPGSPWSRLLYVIVEKILAYDESLPENWPVHGTVGYEFLNTVNGLFVAPQGERPLTALYTRFSGNSLDFDTLAYQCKRLIVKMSMGSELQMLGHRLDRISERNRLTRDFTLHNLTRSLQEVVACFSVYRTYVEPDNVLERDVQYVDRAVARAKRHHPAMSASTFDFVRDVLLLRYHENADEEERRAIQRFAGRFQQLTGPIMAKAVEDTAFYRYNRLVSLNEVGGHPARFGSTVDEFHQLNRSRLPLWPHTWNATSTHDTKRSEDLRARIDVLSEVPREWHDRVLRWSRWHRRLKTNLEGGEAPSRNSEYLLYQTLVGIWPDRIPLGRQRVALLERLQQYMLKVVREAKVNTSWISPHEAYEVALANFVAGVLQEKTGHPFLREMDEFAGRVAEHGYGNSLAQLLLKVGSPGVPDFYQGTELWCRTLVDPDNRQPVDMAAARRSLQQLLGEMARAVGRGEPATAVEEWLAPRPAPRSDPATDSPADSQEAVGERRFLQRLLARRSRGQIKQFLTLVALRTRRQFPDLFTGGDYQPLVATGRFADHVVAFARCQGNDRALVIVPRLTVSLVGFGGPPPLGDVWDNTELEWPEFLGDGVYHNRLTRERVPPPAASAPRRLRVADLLRSFPVALLVSTPARCSASSG